ncbi:hypothetical protein AVEN_223538-1 [Araneus ventricosus]|uniref:Uncharacterized protein n=1 Tax=Araneus ventricosus TaxID=182803 RepID=A0A4Y2UJ96_ARAVE|nr:hypothetical protein AVEN_223538-1 [Araneus ventricosus]
MKVGPKTTWNSDSERAYINGKPNMQQTTTFVFFLQSEVCMNRSLRNKFVKSCLLQVIRIASAILNEIKIIFCIIILVENIGLLKPIVNITIVSVYTITTRNCNTRVLMVFALLGCRKLAKPNQQRALNSKSGILELNGTSRIAHL